MAVITQGCIFSLHMVSYLSPTTSPDKLGTLREELQLQSAPVSKVKPVLRIKEASTGVEGKREGRKKNRLLSPSAPGLSDKTLIRGMDQQPLFILLSLSGITT